jgi:hypothetical protein
MDPSISAAIYALVLEVQGLRRDLASFVGLGMPPGGTSSMPQAPETDPRPKVGLDDFLLLIDTLEDHLLPDLRKLMRKRSEG